jgi:7-cyano-7-deazaguanine reductase
MTDQHVESTIVNAPLGKEVAYPTSYSPELLYPISRSVNRKLLNYSGTIPFMGADIWNAYELSWLGPRGKPEVAIAQFQIPANSPYIVESKSFKLYLNSLNYATFNDISDVKSALENDLSQAIGVKIKVTLLSPIDWDKRETQPLLGKCMDRLDIEIDPSNAPDASILKADFAAGQVEETLYTNLLRSNCPVTGQPDWGTLIIQYKGPLIDEASLLTYIIAFRNHQEFHEHCVEKIFCDVKDKCQATELSVYARYTRRGGLDINPFRTNFNAPWPFNTKLARQ